MKGIQGWLDEDVREETVNMAGGVGGEYEGNTV